MVQENMGERRRSDCSFRIRPPWRGLKSYMFRGIPLWPYHPIPYKRAAAPVAALFIKPMQPIKHHTIVTGHIRKLVPQEYNPDIIRTTREAIDYALGETEPVALFRGLDPDVKFAFETFSGDGLKCTVYGKTGEPCIVFIVVRQANSIARQQYADLLKIDNGPKRAKSKMPEAPFCSVALTKHLEDARNQEILKWVGDYEGCAAIAWLYGDMVWGGEEFKIKTKAKDDLSAWVFFGTEKFAPTEETVKLFGKCYLEDFVENSRNEVLKNTPPNMMEAIAPFLMRLDKLKKMLQE